MNLSERRIREYVRCVLQEAKKVETLGSLRGVMSPVQEVVKKIDTAFNERKIDGSALYKLRTVEVEQFVQKEMLPVIKEIDVFKPYGEVDTNLKNLALTVLRRGATTGNYNDLTLAETHKSYKQDVTAAGGSWSSLSKQFADELAGKIETLRPKIEDLAVRLEEKLTQAVQAHEATLVDARTGVQALRDSFSAAVDAAVPSFLSGQGYLRMLRTQHMNPYAVNSRLQDVKGIEEVAELVHALDIVSPIDEKTLRKTLVDYFEKTLKDLDKDPVETTGHIKRIISRLESFSGVIEDIDSRAREDEVAQSDEEAPDGSPLGKIAFAPSRNRVPFEINTDVEDSLLDDLIKHFEGSSPLSASSARQIKSFIENGWYSPIFKSTESPMLYRGIAVKESWLRRRLGKEDVPRRGTVKLDYVYGKDGETSSWTDSLGMAGEFSEKYIDTDEPVYNVVMHARLRDNSSSFLDATGLYRVADLSNYENESEQIGLGAIRVFKISWVRRKND